MKKALSWKILLIIAVLSYVLKFLIKGDMFSFLFEVIGLISLVSGIVGLVTHVIQKKRKEKTKEIELNNNPNKINFGKISIIIACIIVGIIVYIITRRLSYNGTSAVVNQINENKIELSENLLKDTATEINKEVPVMIDSETRLDEVTAMENGLIYKYTLVNLNQSDVDYDSFRNKLKEKLINSVCSSSEMEIYVKNKAILDYFYYDKNGFLIGDIMIATEIECKE